MWFDLHFLSQSSLLQLGIHLDIQVKPWQILWQFYQKYVSLLVGLWQLLLKIGIFVSRPKLSRDSGFSSKIETIPPNSRRLDTRQGFLGSPGKCFPGKKLLKFEIFKLLEMHWNCQSYHHRVIFVSLKNILRFHQADLFGSWGGGGCVRTPRTPPPAYGPA